MNFYFGKRHSYSKLITFDGQDVDSDAYCDLASYGDYRSLYLYPPNIHFVV